MQNMLDPSGPYAARIAELWWLMLGVCAAVFVAVLAAFLIALARGRRAAAYRNNYPVAVSGAVAVSTLLLLFLIGASVLTDRALAKIGQENALKIEVVANQWWWMARYDDATPSRMFTTANELHIPVGRPVTLTLKSSDVIHSFWVPNLHGKKDLIPGRVATLTIKADKPGTYRGQCAEFCGHQHAKMAFLLVAQPQAEYDAWASAQRKPATDPSGAREQKGRELFVQGTCGTCHAVSGTPAQGMLGPDLTHFASRRTIGAGALPNTREALEGWIADPHRSKPGVRMPAHSLADDDMQALLAYLGTLK
jgi:cytochrome c oxidase subunit II